ncbi:MAG TPA: pyridoxal-phosphate dependent enzyme, partial [bacterium]|nr:pyridoxal-phosphate dependent enzyme [bacterium]
GGTPGKHKIQGIGAGFVPDVLNRSVIDRVMLVDDQDAWKTSLELAAREGILGGVSTGAACWAALQVARELGAGKTVVAIFPDTGERYLSMDEVFKQ